MNMNWQVTVQLAVPDHIIMQLFIMILAQGDVQGQRNNVELIKFVREEMRAHCGACDLKAAKDLIDEIMRRLRNFVEPRPLS